MDPEVVTTEGAMLEVVMEVEGVAPEVAEVVAEVLK